MLFDFLFFVLIRVLRGYFQALSLLSISLVLVIFGTLKYMIVHLIPGVMDNGLLRGFFQLSIFLFIPLFVFLYNKKYKLKLPTNNNSNFDAIPQWVHVCSFSIVILIDFVLFGYLIVA